MSLGAHITEEHPARSCTTESLEGERFFGGSKEVMGRDD